AARAEEKSEDGDVQGKRDENISPVKRVAEETREQQRQQIAAIAENVSIVVQEPGGRGIKNDAGEHECRRAEAIFGVGAKNAPGRRSNCENDQQKNTRGRR